MAESSLRAARSERRGGLPNALFVVASAECPPAELTGLADELTITFPWGSLLRGALARDDAAAAGIAGLVRPGGRVVALVSITARDRLGLAPIRDGDGATIATRWARHDLTLRTFAPADDATIAATGSTWARRLGAGAGGRARSAWRLILERDRGP